MDGVSAPCTHGVSVPRAPRSAGPAKKRTMRRPYKSMAQDKLISKRVDLQAKLDVLRLRVDTWSCKVDKYNFELDARETSLAGEAVGGTSSVEETSA
jgi:hypothetical protein